MTDLGRRGLPGKGATAGAALVASDAWSKSKNMGLPELAGYDSAATQT